MKKIKEKINNLTNKQRKVLYYTVVGIVILGLVAGLTFAWFSATVRGNETAKGDVVETASLGIKYTNGNEIKGEDIMPGWSQTKTFTVENIGDSTAYYNINWENLTNEFVNKSDLTLTITSTNNGGSITKREISCSGSHKRIISYIPIEAGVTQTYTVTVEYRESGSDQNSDQGKKLLGKLEVEEFSPSTAADYLISKAPTTTGTINTDGLMKLEQPATGQTPALTEYRYSGSDVKNYVTFNNEPWRIIGVFEVDDGTGNYEQRVKIMRDESIGNRKWDSSGVNEWSTASLKTELNGTYYNGLSSTAQNMIDNAKWYTSSYNPNGETSSIAYTSERASTTEQFGSTRNTNWTGKIVLAYGSDYGYASSGCYAGSKDIYNYGDTTCKNSNWMLKESDMWLLSPRSGVGRGALDVISVGSVSYNHVDFGIGVWPVTYLKSSVVITGGTGTSSDPYTVSL